MSQAGGVVLACLYLLREMVRKKKLLWSVAKAVAWAIAFLLALHYLALAWYTVPTSAKTYTIKNNRSIISTADLGRWTSQQHLNAANAPLLLPIKDAKKNTPLDKFSIMAIDDYSKYEGNQEEYVESEFKIDFSLNNESVVASNKTKSMAPHLPELEGGIYEPGAHPIPMDAITSCRCVLASSACPESLLGGKNLDTIFWNNTFGESSKVVPSLASPMDATLFSHPKHCRLMSYTNSEVRTCFETMGKDESTSRSFLFMGDAKVRDIFTAFLEATQSLDYSVNFEGETWTTMDKYLYPVPKRPHQKIQAQSRLLGTQVRVKHYWSPWLGVHAKNQIKAILQLVKAKGGAHRRLAPAFLVIGFGAWMTSSVNWLNTTEALDQEASLLRTYKNALKEVEGPLKQLSNEIPVIWALPWPAMESTMQGKGSTKKKRNLLLESRNQLGLKLVTITRRSFNTGPNNVILWDTSWGVQKAHFQQCQARMSQVQQVAISSEDNEVEKKKSKRCSDMNSNALRQLAQVLLNFVCNKHSPIHVIHPFNATTEGKQQIEKQLSTHSDLCCG